MRTQTRISDGQGFEFKLQTDLQFGLFGVESPPPITIVLLLPLLYDAKTQGGSQSRRSIRLNSDQLQCSLD
jgi:hypothetical protein